MLSITWRRLLLKPTTLVFLGVAAVLTQIGVCVSLPGVDFAAFGNLGSGSTTTTTTNSGASFGCTFRYWWQVTCQ